MNSYKNSLQQTFDYLNSLTIDEHTNALWDILHIIRWHKGADYVMWIQENKDIIQEVIKYEYITDMPNELKNKVWHAVKEIEMLHR